MLSLKIFKSFSCLIFLFISISIFAEGDVGHGGGSTMEVRALNALTGEQWKEWLGNNGEKFKRNALIPFLMSLKPEDFDPRINKFSSDEAKKIADEFFASKDFVIKDILETNYILDEPCPDQKQRGKELCTKNKSENPKISPHQPIYIDLGVVVENKNSFDDMMVNFIHDHARHIVGHKDDDYEFSNRTKRMLFQREEIDVLYLEIAKEQVKKGGLEFVKFWTEKGIDPSFWGEGEGRYFDKFCPMKYAAFYGHQNIIEYLLEKGADINRHGCNVLGNAAYSAADNNSTDLLKFLIRNDAEMFSANLEENALAVSVILGHTEAVELLLANDADPNKIVGYSSAYRIPTYAVAIIQSQIRRGIEGRLGDNDFEKRKQLLKMMIDAGADLNNASYGKGNVLHLLVEYGHTKWFDFLFEAEPNLNINEQNRALETPLHKAVHFERPYWVEILLGKGAKKTIRDYDGQTPIGYVRQEIRNPYRVPESKAEFRLMRNMLR